MLDFMIPGWGKLVISNLILDFNGTIAVDGRMIEGVAERLWAIRKQGVDIYIITADTNGTVEAECQGLPVKVMVYDKETVSNDKCSLVMKLGASRTASIGNGRNDGAMFSASALSVAVIGREGAFLPSVMKSDILVTNILDGLELFLKGHRLKATLRG